jgi:hypothetical protein
MNIYLRIISSYNKKDIVNGSIPLKNTRLIKHSFGLYESARRLNYLMYASQKLRGERNLLTDH